MEAAGLHLLQLGGPPASPRILYSRLKKTMTAKQNAGPNGSSRFTPAATRGPSRQPKDFILKAKEDNDSKTKRRAKWKQQVHTCCD